MTTTKNMLSRRIAEKEMLIIPQAEIIVRSVFGLIGDSLALGNKVELNGFGRFRVVSTKCGKVIKFKPAEPLKRKVKSWPS